MMATFYVGLTLAGAISAGAYNAGVFDFLLEALEAWERRKQELRDQGVPTEQWDVPSHDVVIPAMSGASAGGITGALGLVALSDARAVSEVDHVRGVGAVTTTLPRLYDAWVRMPSFVDSGGGGLLGDDDLKALESGQTVASLLDTTLLWRIVEKSLLGIGELRPRRPYLGENLHLYLTHANLRGVPYAVRFLTDGRQEQGYDMMCHADRVHYVVDGIGSHRDFQSPWAAPEQVRAISVDSLPGLASVTGEWEDYALAAVGSGAFPAGLSARVIQGVTVEDYRTRQWPTRRSGRGGAPTFDLQPTFPPPLADDPAAAVGYVTIDGGTINNEPFELVRWTLMKSPPEGNPRDALKADRAVIMIDPFPQAPDYDSTGNFDASLAAVIRKLLPTLKNQARFKPDDAAEALDETIYSRFLIAPRRKRDRDSPELERHAIACGLLGGFGGFLAKQFRAHDYQLGRLNAYLFLKDAFALPLGGGEGGTQVVLGDGYGPGARLARFQTASADPAHPGTFYQIIPVLPEMPVPPAWPRVDRGVVDAMVQHAARRADAVVGVLKSGMRSRFGRWAAGAAWRLYGQGAVTEFARWSVVQDLIRRDQLQGPSAGQTEAVRLTMAGLADPGYDLRTVAGIAARSGLASEAVGAAVDHLKGEGLLWEGPSGPGDAPTYTLKERKPAWHKRWSVSGTLAID